MLEQPPGTHTGRTSRPVEDGETAGGRGFRPLTISSAVPGINLTYSTALQVLSDPVKISFIFSTVISSIVFSLFTITAIPSMAIVVPVRTSFSLSLRSRDCG